MSGTIRNIPISVTQKQRREAKKIARVQRTTELIAASFGGRLKEWRNKRSLTQEQAAESLGIPSTTYRSYEQRVRTPNKFTQKTILEIINGA